MNTTIVQFEAQVVDIQKVNPMFSKCKVRVLYTGLNRNNSFFSEDAVKRAIPTIYNIPLVGEFIETIDDFGTHGGKLEISDKGIKIIETTKPYGVVPESATIYWETVTELDGFERKYLSVDGCYLWTGRYPEAQQVIEEGKGQSMEIEVISGDFNQEQNFFDVKDFTFSALCILGKDVEPCFESASIKAYSLDKEDFKLQFATMLKELKFSLGEAESQMKGGQDVPETNENEVTQEEVFEVAEPEAVVEEVLQEQEQEIVQVEVQEEFEQEAVVVETEVEAPAPVVAEVFTDVQADLEALRIDYADLVLEVEALRQFKQDILAKQRSVAEEALFEQFASQLTEEEILSLKEKASDVSLEDLELQLFALVGKKKVNFSFKKRDAVKIDLLSLGGDHPANDSDKPYGHLFDKYK